MKGMEPCQTKTLSPLLLELVVLSSWSFVVIDAEIRSKECPGETTKRPRRWPRVLACNDAGRGFQSKIPRGLKSCALLLKRNRVFWRKAVCIHLLWVVMSIHSRGLVAQFRGEMQPGEENP
jgi:hypothetical protein